MGIFTLAGAPLTLPGLRSHRSLTAAVSLVLFLTFSVSIDIASAQSSTSGFLAANGLNVCNNYGQGDAVPLRGVNMGSWLLMEPWMCPMDASGLPDSYSALQALDSRFGVATEQSLIRTYQSTWITTNDLNNIKALGMNYVRMPFWWGDVETLNGTWRADAFAQMDWLVTNAWQRGIYTLVDFHGVVGGQSPSQSTGQQNLNQYWTNVLDQTQTSMIWSNVAAHFAGNPAVLGYDLINEPYGAPSQAALWAAYNSLYQTVRAVDPNHIVIMEGAWAGTGTDGESLNWQWDVLPPPSHYGWTNVVYSMHAYPGGSDTPADELSKQVSDFIAHQSWNVPDLIGEYNWEDNTTSDWTNGTLQFDANNMNWSDWAYKATTGSAPNSWGFYASGNIPTPTLTNDSITTISNDWTQCGTPAFGVTTFLFRDLGAPLAVADAYTNMGGGVMTVSSAQGVLANDLDTNLGQSGITLTAVLVSNPTNGQLTLNTNGSFTYTPNPGFLGTDTFRYRDFDGYVSSANIANVSIQVGPGQVSQLVWTTQPGQATVGAPFVQQPVLITEDQNGKPSITGLAATQNVVITLSSGTGPLLGTTQYNIGTAGSNGAISFSDLEINQPGTTNVLTATALSSYGAPVSGSQLWLDGSDPTTIVTNTSGQVSEWTDKSGNANNFFTNILVTTSGSVWYTNANTPSGRRTVTFPGTIGLWCHSYANSGANVSVLLVTKKRVPGAGNGGQYQGPFSANNASYNDYNNPLGFTLDYGSSENTPQVERGSSFSYGTFEPSSAYHLFEFVGTSSLNTLWLNGAGAKTGGSTVADFSITNLAVGCRLNAASSSPAWGNQYYDGDVAEILVYNTALSTASRQADEAYLSNKWMTAAYSFPISNAVSSAFVVQALPGSATNDVTGITANINGTCTLGFVGAAGGSYFVQMATNLVPPINWQTVPGSAITVTNSTGLWSCTISNTASQTFYRSVESSP